MFAIEAYIKRALTTEPYYSEVRSVFDNGTGTIDFTSKDKATFGYLIFNLVFTPGTNPNISNASNIIVFQGVGLYGSNNFMYVILGTRFFMQGNGFTDFGFNYQEIYGKK